MIEARLQTDADGAILFDPAATAQGQRFEPGWFDRAYWQRQGLADSSPGGRGEVSYVRAPFGHCVLRHYHRGGMVARVLGDRYLWTGAERTRSFAEFRLLVELYGRRLPVPKPVAARYRRQGLHYRADLITRCIENTRTLAAILTAGCCDKAVAGDVGATIARFHAAGVYHADLNAHNILLDGHAVSVVDFDRGDLRHPARNWQLGNLMRLKRSLLKLGADSEGQADFEHGLWSPLMQAYEREFDVARSRAGSPA